MSFACLTFASRAAARRRGGFSWTGLSGVLAALVVAAPVAWYAVPSGGDEDDTGLLVEQVRRGAFIHELTERGDVESSSTVDVRCEVQSGLGSGSGTALLEIVPEGTRVKQGDVIGKLDSSRLENEFNAQQIVVNGSSAALIGARAILTSANIARQEYLEGTFKQEEQLIQSEIFVAEENLRRAEEYVNFSAKLAARNFVTSVTLEADRFAVEKARKDLGVATTKLRVLRDFTKAKMLNQLDAAIETAAADLTARTDINRIDIQKLELIEKQIGKCTIIAPQDGEVTYANSSDMRDSDAVVIKEGVLLRERQPIVKLPDPDRMQVNAKVNESKIRLIKIGMPAIVKVEALAGAELPGIVSKVFAYANRSRWSSSTIKEFSVIVEIQNPPAELRTGSSAEVLIRVNQSPDELLVPVQAVLEHGGKHYCVWRKDGAWVAKPVELGATNDNMVVIKSGVTEADQVVLNPRAHLEELNLPELPAKVIQAETMLAGKQELNPAGDAKNVSSAAPDGAATGAPPAAPGGADRAAMLLAANDKNSDGRLSQDELPPQMINRFSAADKNADGFLDADELSSMPRGGRRPSGDGAAPQNVGGGAGQ